MFQKQSMRPINHSMPHFVKIAALSILAMWGHVTHAAEGAGTLVNPLKASSIPKLLAVVLRGLVEIGSIILVLMLVWVGFMFVMAQGNEEKIKSARQALMWTVVGGLILLGATAIAELIEATVTAL